MDQDNQNTEAPEQPAETATPHPETGPYSREAALAALSGEEAAPEPEPTPEPEPEPAPDASGDPTPPQAEEAAEPEFNVAEIEARLATARERRAQQAREEQERRWMLEQQGRQAEERRLAQEELEMLRRSPAEYLDKYGHNKAEVLDALIKDGTKGEVQHLSRQLEQLQAQNEAMAKQLREQQDSIANELRSYRQQQAREQVVSQFHAMLAPTEYPTLSRLPRERAVEYGDRAADAFTSAGEQADLATVARYAEHLARQDVDSLISRFKESGQPQESQPAATSAKPAPSKTLTNELASEPVSTREPRTLEEMREAALRHLGG